MRAQEFVKDYQGIDLSLDTIQDPDGDIIEVRAHKQGRPLGFVMFTTEYDSQGPVLNPQDLKVDPRYQRQGIARAMYDWVKSQGYRIRRSGQQTAAGAAFWDKYRPGKNIWENK